MSQLAGTGKATAVGGLLLFWFGFFMVLSPVLAGGRTDGAPLLMEVLGSTYQLAPLLAFLAVPLAIASIIEGVVAMMGRARPVGLAVAVAWLVIGVAASVATWAPGLAVQALVIVVLLSWGSARHRWANRLPSGATTAALP